MQINVKKTKLQAKLLKWNFLSFVFDNNSTNTMIGLFEVALGFMLMKVLMTEALTTSKVTRMV